MQLKQHHNVSIKVSENLLLPIIGESNNNQWTLSDAKTGVIYNLTYEPKSKVYNIYTDLYVESLGCARNLMALVSKKTNTLWFVDINGRNYQFSI